MARRSKPQHQASGASAERESTAQSGSAASFPIVALGASAGGLEALEQFLSHVPAASGMAYVVIQHLDPTRPGMMPELLGRVTTMNVVEAVDGMAVEPNRVYIIPPNKEMLILRDRLNLLDPLEARGLRLPIDVFFRALADERRERAIVVVLSGMGSDGTLGLKAVKEQGGLVLAQDPASASFDGMPRSAIDTGLVDIVAPAEDLPARLSAALRHFRTVPIAQEADAHNALDKIIAVLRARSGHDFSRYKQGTLCRRIERRMGIHQIPQIADYVRFLHGNPVESDLLFKELLIGVTQFFRDRDAWVQLQQCVLPGLLQASPHGRALRAWVPACSTGEEAYSLAIAFREVLEYVQSGDRYTLQVFATDLDQDAIAKARQGFYPANIAADVEPGRLDRFFHAEPGGYRVCKDIRDMVIFAPQDIVSDPPFTKLDILSCRNLLIYLDASLQKRLLPLFHYSLNPGGVLFLGSAESIGEFTDLFAPLDLKTRLYQRLGGGAPGVEFPTKHFTALAIPQDTASGHHAVIDLQAVVETLILREFAPAAILVNGKGDIAYISGRTGNYLEPAAGRANWNIHAMAREGLRHELAAALRQSLRQGGRVDAKGLSVDTHGGRLAVELSVQALADPPELRGMALVVFKDLGLPPIPDPALPTQRPRSGNRRVAHLEAELASAHAEIRTLRLEMQTALEDQRAAYEELQSANEELQSTNEELTTSKEEMQSLNEELQTVNAELQSKLEDLSRTSNDMKNLLDSTQIATIFLDGQLKVRRFTSSATVLFRLIASDVGRPLSDIVSDLTYPELFADTQDVLRSLVFSEKAVATLDGRWFNVRIMPYRTFENMIDGVVITLTDITASKRLEAQLRQDGAPSA